MPCDPYLQPGYLTINPHDITGTYWTPHDPSCPRAPSFLADVRDRRPLPWLEGRTLLLVGDSIERNNLRFFCDLVGSTDLRTTPMRNLSATLRQGHTILEPADITRPNVCRVPEYDFEIVSFFHYGMQEQNIWNDTRIYTAPAIMEERVGTVFDLFFEYERDWPDMVILASGRTTLLRPWQLTCRALGFSGLGEGGCTSEATVECVYRSRSSRPLDFHSRTFRWLDPHILP